MSIPSVSGQLSDDHLSHNSARPAGPTIPTRHMLFPSSGPEIRDSILDMRDGEAEMRYRCHGNGGGGGGGGGGPAD